MTTIITRHNETPGVQPSGGSVAVGELCVNTGDGTLWTSSDGGNIVPVGGGGGGSGDLPVGTSDGQMLKWTATGSPTWAITDAIKVSSDNNVSVGGPQYSSAYKFTVNGNMAIAGNLLMSDLVADAVSATNVTVTTDPATGNALARKSYLDATYAFKSNTVTLNATQTVTGAKTFSSATTQNLNHTGGGFTLSFSGLATGSNEYLRLGTTGAVFTSSTIAAADVEIAPGESLADTIAALKAQIVALGGTI